MHEFHAGIDVSVSLSHLTGLRSQCSCSWGKQAAQHLHDVKKRRGINVELEDLNYCFVVHGRSMWQPYLVISTH